MRKFIAILLCNFLMLSLVACGGNKDNNENQNNSLDNSQMDNNGGNANTPTDEPSAEDLTALNYYRLAMEELNKYAETGDLYDIYFEYDDFGIESEEDGVEGMGALAAYYDLLTKLDAVDKWVGTEYTDNEEINWDRKEVLESFKIVNDVPLYVTGTHTDHLGNETIFIPGHMIDGDWRYDENGTVLASLFETEYVEIGLYNPTSYLLNGSSCVGWTYEYDDAGQISTIKGRENFNDDDKPWYEWSVGMLRTFTYDADGKIIEELAKTNNDEMLFKYSYDANDHLIQISWVVADSLYYTIDYSYDAAGNMTTSEETKAQYRDSNLLVQEKKIMEYSYNGGSLPVSATYTFQLHYETYTYDVGYESYLGNETRDQISYNYDQQGRLISKTITYGKTYTYDAGNSDNAVYEDQPADQKTTYNIIYGDYYIYTPAN